MSRGSRGIFSADALKIRLMQNLCAPDSAIMIIGWRNQSIIRLISLPNDKFGSE